MSDEQEQQREARRRELLQAVRTPLPPNPGLPTWCKVILILLVGIPVGLIALGGLVLGVCLLGTR
ncbi:MAG: hypothetical protein ABI411_06180 [Tahibacter sp.]